MLYFTYRKGRQKILKKIVQFRRTNKRRSARKWQKKQQKGKAKNQNTV